MHRLIAILVASIVAVTACAPQVQQPQAQQTSSAPKVVTFGVGLDAINMELTQQNDTPTFGIAFNAVEPLFRRGPDYTMQNVLANSYTTNPDASVWEVKLRPNVKFHNGNPLDAEAVKFTYDKILDPARKPASILFSVINFISKVDVIDPLTVKFTLKNPNLLFREQARIVGIVDPKYYAANDAAYLTTHLNGTGPFILKEWKKDSHATLVKNPDYWGDKPKIDELTYKVIPEVGARIAALKTGAVDAIDQVAIDDLDQLSATDGIKVASVLNERTVGIHINQLKGRPELKDIRLRQAMNHAVDVDAIIKNLLKGEADRVPGTIARKTTGFYDVKPYAYDPAKAKQLVASMNLPADFSLTLSSPNNNFPKDKEAAEAIAGYLRAVGINVKLQITPNTEFIAAKNAGKLGDLWFIGWDSGAWDGLTDMTWQGKKGNTLWADQYVYDPDLDGLLRRAEAETNADKKIAYMRDAQKLMYDRAYSVFLYTTKSFYAYRTKLEGFAVPVDRIWSVSVIMPGLSTR